MRPLSTTGKESLDRALTFELKHIDDKIDQIDYGTAKPQDLVEYALDINTVLSERSPTRLASRIGKRLLDLQSQIHSAAEKDKESFRSDILTGIGYILAPHRCKPGVPLWVLMANSLINEEQSEVEHDDSAVDALVDQSPGVQSTNIQSIMGSSTASEYTENVDTGTGQNDRGQWWWSKDTGPIQSEGGKWFYGQDTSLEQKGVTMDDQ